MLLYLKIVLISFVLFVDFAPHPSHAASISSAQDIMSSQKIGVPSNHLISFRSNSGMADGAITLNFSSVAGSMGSVDNTDIDLSYGPTGIETSALLSQTAGNATWGAAVNATTKTVALTFPSSGGIPIAPSDRVIVKIGTHARAQTNGYAQIINAALPANNLVIDITAGDDSGKIGVVILSNESIGVTGSQPTPTTRTQTTQNVSPSGAILVDPPLPAAPTSTPKQPSVAKEIVPEKNPNVLRLPTNVRDLTIVEEYGNARLSWTNPNDSDIATIQIQRKEEGFPSAPTDGTTRARALLNIFVDTGLNPGRTYYYTVFVVNTLGVSSSGSVGALTLNKPEKNALQELSVQEMPPQKITVQEPPPASVPAAPQMPLIVLAESTTQIVPPQQQASISATHSDGSGITLTVPPTVATNPIEFNVQPFTVQQASEWVSDISQPLADDEIVGGIIYRITAKEGGDIRTNFDTTLTMQFRYTHEQMQNVHEENIKAFHWDAVLSQWIEEPSSVLDAVNNTVTIRVSHLSFYSLQGAVTEEARSRHSEPARTVSLQDKLPTISNITAGDLRVMDETRASPLTIDGRILNVAPETKVSVCLDRSAVRHPTRTIVLTVDMSVYLFSSDETNGCYTTTFESPDIQGTYPLTLKILYEDDAEEIIRATLSVAVEKQASPEALPRQTDTQTTTINESIRSAVVATTPVLQAITIATIPAVEVINHALAAHVLTVGPSLDHASSVVLTFFGFRRRRKPLVVTKKTLAKYSLAFLLLSFATSAALQLYTPGIFQLFAFIANAAFVVFYLTLLRQK